MSGTNDKSQRPAILIVEDQLVMRGLLRNLVHTAFPDCVILEAANGANGMQMCAEHSPQLVLMDVGLPDANGIELTGRLKALMPGLSVIVVTFHSSQSYIEQAFAAGACAYVVKDRLLSTLIPAVADALGIAPLGSDVPPGRAS